MTHGDLRKFSPLTWDHPLVGRRCDLCHRRFTTGDEVYVAPDGMVYHWDCEAVRLGLKGGEDW